MSVIYLVLPLAVLLSVLAVVAFVWAARRGQLDDLQTPAVRILHDDAPSPRAPRAGEIRWNARKSPSDAT
jgi:cbb3-type cytochrome oxidase maturation protein